MTTVTEDGEIIEDPGTAISPFASGGAVLSVDDALAEWKDYQRLTRELLDESDYQKIGNRKFKKKSAWRKYGRAFRISCVVTHEEIIRAPDGFPLYARVRILATDQRGNRQEADHEAHVTERCCPTAEGKPCPKKAWQSHQCCADGCNGRVHWSHPGDLPATATTRAKNRAISDIIGAGEVSAEEMEGEAKEAPQRQAAPQRPLPPKPTAPQGGEERPTPAEAPAPSEGHWSNIVKQAGELGYSERQAMTVLNMKLPQDFHTRRLTEEGCMRQLRAFIDAAVKRQLSLPEAIGQLIAGRATAAPPAEEQAALIEED